jgi:WD40 repeat protein
VFLSYARKDGEAFATALRRRLAEEEPQITLWQDRAQLEGGVGWWVQIEEALDRVMFLVIVMTPYAMRSENTAREWRYARQRGVNVYPVKGVPDEELDYGTIPRWMRKSHFYDLGRFVDGEWRDAKEWGTFVDHLKSDRQPVRVPFMAPDLPAGFVPRTREFDEVLHRLLGPSGEQPVAITTALQGAGGYGKTTLAVALCHDERVIEAFDDGVLWTALGQTPQLEEKLASLYAALSREPRTFIDVTQGGLALSEKLESRNCLLVIDDVWQRKHLEPFLKGGHQCVRLVTTRKFDLVGGNGCVRVDEMTTAESIDVLAAAFPAGAVPQARLAALASRLGEWPLLMNLAAGMIRVRLDYGDSAEGALAYVERLLDKYGVTAFDPDEAEQRDEFVRKTVAASRDQLSPADSRRFLDLAIFPEEIAIPMATLARAWDLDDVDTQRCAQRLAAVSLLQLDLQRRVVSLHDVMRAYLLRELGDPVPVHARLVDAYGDVERPADAYAWRWLPYHLKHAGRVAALRSLLLRPEWLHGKLRAAGPHALIADFDLAGGDQDLDVLLGAIRLGLPALARDPGQLWEQLLGRLPPGLSNVLDTVLREVARAASGPRLHARWANLQAPGGALEQTLHHENLIFGATLLPDGRPLSWSGDGSVRIWNLATGEYQVVYSHKIGVSRVRLLSDGRVLTLGSGGRLHLVNVATGNVRVLDHSPQWLSDAVELPGGAVLSWGFDSLLVWNLSTGESRALGRHDRVQGALPLAQGRVLSWNKIGSMYVWELATGDRRELTGGGTMVSGAVSLPDGRAVSWSEDSTLQIWDPGGDSHVLPGHTGRINGARLLPDGRLLSWSADGTLRVWDLATGHSRELTGQAGAIRGGLPLPDGRMLSWSAEGALIVWDLTSGEGRRMPGHNGDVAGTLLLADGRVLSWSSDNTMRVTNIVTAEGRVVAGHDGMSGALQLADARVLSWTDRALHVWNLAACEGRTMIGHVARVNGSLLLPGGRVLSWSEDRTLRISDVESGEGRVLAGHTGAVRGAALDAAGRILSWSGDGTLQLWDFATGRAQVFTGHEGFVANVLMLPQARALSWGEDSTFRLWDLASGRDRVLAGPGPVTLGALLLPDGRVLSWSNDYALRVYDLSTGESRLLAQEENSVRGALALPAGRVLSWSLDGRLRIRDLANGDDAQTLFGHREEVIGAVLLPEGSVLSWAQEDYLVVWDTATGQGRPLEGHRAWIGGARPMSDGRVLSWADDGTLGIWDVASGTGRIVTAHQGWISGAELLPDGRVLTWGADRSVRVRRLDRDEQELASYFDAEPTAALHHPSGGLFVGDGLGRIHFLEILDS